MSAIIKSKLALFQVQVESVLWHTTKFDKAYFGKAPEAFDAVYMVGADGEFILAVLDSIMLLIAQIDDAVRKPSVWMVEAASTLPLIIA